MLIKSKDNKFSSKSYRNTSYEKKKRFIISLIHTVEVRWKEQRLMSIFRGLILMEAFIKFMNDEIYNLDIKGLFHLLNLI